MPFGTTTCPPPCELQSSIAALKASVLSVLPSPIAPYSGSVTSKMASGKLGATVFAAICRASSQGRPPLPLPHAFHFDRANAGWAIRRRAVTPPATISPALMSRRRVSFACIPPFGRPSLVVSTDHLGKRTPTTTARAKARIIRAPEACLKADGATWETTTHQLLSLIPHQLAEHLHSPSVRIG